MYQQFNEQFAAATRQFADTAAQINRIALSNAQAVFGLQAAMVEERVNATFGFFGEAAETRDADGLKNLLPKAAQVARENLERVLSTGQEVMGRNVKAQEEISGIAKAQFESAAQNVQANAETVQSKFAEAAKAATPKSSVK